MRLTSRILGYGDEELRVMRRNCSIPCIELAAAARSELIESKKSKQVSRRTQGIMALPGRRGTKGHAPFVWPGATGRETRRENYCRWNRRDAATPQYRFSRRLTL